jgi:hypothetical protein
MIRVLLGMTAALLAATSVGAHHSFASYYFEEQSVTIEGEVVEFDYRAPHAWLYLMAPDPAGQVRRFSAEWANPQRLMRDGVNRDTLRAGDRVIVTGSPGRTASEHKIHLKLIQRPADNWEWNPRRTNARPGTRRR